MTTKNEILTMKKQIYASLDKNVLQLSCWFAAPDTFPLLRMPGVVEWRNQFGKLHNRRQNGLHMHFYVWRGNVLVSWAFYFVESIVLYEHIYELAK